MKFHLSKSVFGIVVCYVLKNWGLLMVFFFDLCVLVDNNRSESVFRVVVIGCKNFLFVGNNGVGQNIVGFLSLVVTCVVNGINLFEYLVDVLIRVHKHPTHELDDLLP